MSIPFVYNIRHIRARWYSSVIAILGIAGTVGVFVAMLSLAKGFKAALVASGSADNVIVLRSGSTNEMDSSVPLDQVQVIRDAPGVAHSGNEALVTPEVVVIKSFPLRSSGTDANVQVRGVSPIALAVRKQIKMVEGRFFQPGLFELLVGRNATRSYAGLKLGDAVKFGGATWKVVGIMDGGGSVFDSEVWADSRVLREVYHYPPDVFRSVTVHLTSLQAFNEFRDALMSDPRMNVDVTREIEFYDKESRTLAGTITLLGGVVAIIMGIGAVFGALNTMYSAVAERGREIATIRALGFGGYSVITSFMIESLFISLVGGALGCLAVLPLNGLTTGAVNWQTFSHLSFAFRITQPLLISGILFSLLMGLLGGVFPAVRAARCPLAAALRAL